MSRNRRTWKKASPPPASYGWEPEHPAHKDDPAMDDYFVGNNDPHDDFAEEPHSGPYAQPAAPASYGWEPDHPAAKADAGGSSEKKASRKLRAMVEKKAAKCVRIAQTMLGKGATVEEIENYALTLMDLSDRQVNASLKNVRKASFYADEMMGEDEMMGGYLAEDEMMAHDMFDEYDHDEDGLIDADEWGGSPEVFDALDSDMSGDLDEEEIAMGLGESFARYASVEDRMLAQMLKEERSRRSRRADYQGRSQNNPQFGYGIQDMEESELTSHFPENLEKKKAFLTAEEELDAEEMAMLAEMEDVADMDPVGIMGEDHLGEEEEIAQMMAEMEDHAEEEIAEEEVAEEMVLAQDPMGLMGEEDQMADDELMANLFGGKFASDDEEEDKEDKEDSESDDEEKEESDEDEKSEKKASRLKPQPRKASTGVKTLGAVNKTATSEMADLEKLWTSAPDISNVFGK